MEFNLAMISMFLVLIIATILQIVTSSKNHLKQTFPYECTYKDRYANCNDVANRAVCGWFDNSIVCDKEPCAFTYSSICKACQNTSIWVVSDLSCSDQEVTIYYDKLNTTNPTNTINTTNTSNSDSNSSSDQAQNDNEWYICTDEDRKVTSCDSIKSTVCGFYGQCTNQEECESEFSSQCQGCKDESIIYIFKGTCSSLDPETIKTAFKLFSDKLNSNITLDDSVIMIEYNFTVLMIMISIVLL